MAETTITTSAIAFTIGRFCPWRMKPKRSSGSVFSAPAVKYVTTISSHESAIERFSAEVLPRLA